MRENVATHSTKRSLPNESRVRVERFAARWSISKRVQRDWKSTSDIVRGLWVVSVGLHVGVTGR